MSQGTADIPYMSKELSWLSFNERVLQEAQNPSVPVIQRLRYLGIFSNNLDEYFRVRVADVSRLAEFSSSTEEKEGHKDLLTQIQQATLKLQTQFEQTYLDVLKTLRKRKIYLVNEQKLDPVQDATVAHIFNTQVLPELDPIILEPSTPFPEITDGLIYLAFRLACTNGSERYGIVEIPTDRLPRFIQIPQREGSRGIVFIVLENIIRHSLIKMFRGVYDIESAAAYTFKVTRDAELELGDGINQTLIDKISHSLKKRKLGDPERFVYDQAMPEDMLNVLTRRLNLDKYHSIMPGSRYHNAKDFMNFPSVGPAYLEFKPLETLQVEELAGFDGNIFDRIREQDILLNFPYHAFDPIIDLLKTAAIDPAVKTIHICLYRAAHNSRVVDALLSAKSNNKDVTAVVELQARFDEAANIDWARQLMEGGVKVIFGVPGLKVHNKLILIGRQEGGLKYYTHIGTGNFNEKTSRSYTDFSLLSHHQDIGKDVANIFDFISYNYRRHDYKLLLVSPHTNRSGFEGLIKQEITNAEAGLPAAITLKCNNLVDPSIVSLLYRASAAGVRVRIICRGMLSLVAGVKGVSENIQAISIIDRFLEHSRVYIFHNAGEPKYYLSSADLMTRNLDFRVEASVPVLDPLLQQRIQDVIDIQWCDNVKSRKLDADQTNSYRRYKINGKIRSQEVIHQYFSTGVLPDAVKRARKRWKKELIATSKRQSK
ncbi:MAG: polyphosphate kinase 1 [Spongiibacteraceae bacterium]